MLAINVQISVLPEQREAWLEAIKDDQKYTRQDEEGNLQFVIGQDVNDENKFYLHEEFINSDAFLKHCATPHFERYDTFCKETPRFVSEPVIDLFHPLEEEEENESQSQSPSKRTIQKGAFGLNVNLYPKPQVRDEFLNVIKNNKKGTDTTEPLALQYTFGEATGGIAGFPDGNPSTFHFHEQYTGEDHGKEGFEAHQKAPHFADWEAFVGTDPFTKPPQVFLFKILEE